MTANHDPENLSGSYVLGGLDAAQITAFEQHLAASEATRNEVTELADTAVLLGLSVEPVAPRAALKRSILDQLDAHPQLTLEQPAAVEAVPTPVGSAQRRAQARWFQRPALSLVSSAAAIALILGAGVAAAAVGQINHENAMATISAAADVQEATVDLPGGSSATLVWSGELLQSALIVDAMSPPPSGHVYELWYFNDGVARPAGTFTVGESGSAWQVLSGSMAAGDAVGVTVELRGGSPVPTSDPIMLIASV
jgi:anti-sigma-K factor RskA